MPTATSNAGGVAGSDRHGGGPKLPFGAWSTCRSALPAVGLLVLLIGSLLLRLEGQRSWLWMDEGLSVGIASHPMSDIPVLLRQDGSPPLYYLLLHGWMKLFGRSELALHALSLMFAVATVPLAFWAGKSLFGRGAGWTCAALAAATPYLTTFAREARMYTLMVLLALLVVTAFLHSFVFGRRRYLPLFVVSSALLLYTHHWALFLTSGLILAAVTLVIVSEDRRRTLLDASIGFGCVGLLYLPWLPTLRYQAAHTGAPWSSSPVPREALSAVSAVLGDEQERVLVALLLTAGVALAPVLPRFGRAEWRPVAALVVIVTSTVVLAWMSSQVQPAWSPRYFGIFLPPLLLLAAVGLSRDGVRGLIALGVIILIWLKPLSWVSGLRSTVRVDDKSNVKQVAAELRPMMGPGDLVVSAEIEQVPLLHHYLPSGIKYATPEGAVRDPKIIDWSDALERLRRADATTSVMPLLEELPPDNHLFVVCPTSVGFTSRPEGQGVRSSTRPDGAGAWDPAPERLHSARQRSGGNWFALAQQHCLSLLSALATDPRMRLVGGPTPPDGREGRGAAVQVMTYQKIRS